MRKELYNRETIISMGFSISPWWIRSTCENKEGNNKTYGFLWIYGKKEKNQKVQQIASLQKLDEKL